MSGSREGHAGMSEAPATRISLHGEALESLTELNEQCLELLKEHAASPEAVGFPLLFSLRDLWAALDSAARLRAAGCPYLIVDAGFANARNWVWGERHAIHDSPGPAVPAFFSGPRATAALRLALTYGWHLARSRPSAARLLLGMPAACAERIATCTLRRIEALADAHIEWLQPRPDSLTVAEVDSTTGAIATPFCPRTDRYVESYIPGTEPRSYCPVHSQLLGLPGTATPAPLTNSPALQPGTSATPASPEGGVPATQPQPRPPARGAMGGAGPVPTGPPTPPNR